MAALVHCYTTVAEVKKRQEIRTTGDDGVIGTVITAVSRLIDDYCRRRFYASTQTRYLTHHVSYASYASGSLRGCLLLDEDLLSITTLKTDIDGDRVYETTWATTDYDLGPPNNAVDGLPYWRIDETPLGRYFFPCIPLGIQIAGSWGFSVTTPPVVAEACLAQVELVMRAPDVALGESGSGPMLTQMRGVGLHPFVRRLLDPLKRAAVG